MRNVFGGGVGRRAALWPRTPLGWVLVIVIFPVYFAIVGAGLVLTIALFVSVAQLGLKATATFLGSLPVDTADTLVKTAGAVLAAVLGYRYARKSDALRERAKALRADQQPIYSELYDALRRARQGELEELNSLERPLATLTLVGSEKVVVLAGNIVRKLRSERKGFTPEMEQDFLDLVFAMREDLGIPERRLEDRHILATLDASRGGGRAGRISRADIPLKP